jgi:hypothetical protein
VGIRGAFNHTVGIQKAGVIIALNQNPRAAIFKAADYGIVGDWQTYLPPLVAALKATIPASDLTPQLFRGMITPPVRESHLHTGENHEPHSMADQGGLSGEL